MNTAKSIRIYIPIKSIHLLDDPYNATNSRVSNLGDGQEQQKFLYPA